MTKKTIYSEMVDKYKSVVIHSLVTSFGLDFLVHDRIGGDVDTIHNVQNGVPYKNATHEKVYTEKKDYDSIDYHSDNAYAQMIRNVRNKGFFEDQYVSGNRIFYGKHSQQKHNTISKANLDHVIAAKEIHEDPGRVLAGKDGIKLANSEWNLKFTNEKLNKSMGKQDILEYIKEQEEKGTPVEAKTEAKMVEAYNQAKRNYNKELNKYYLSQDFWNDALSTASNVGVQMGIRQALGFVFLEIWLSCEKELELLPSKTNISTCLSAIRKGIKQGISEAQKKYKDFFRHFGEGYITGIFASLSTTLLNIFATTTILKAKIIRQLFMTGVQTSNILLMNPQDDLLGDQMQKASIVLITGICGIPGIIVGQGIANIPLPMPLKSIVRIFVCCLVSGLLACTILTMIDRSELISKLITKLDEYGSLSTELKMQNKQFSELACQLADFDIKDYEGRVNEFNSLLNIVDNCDENELNNKLLSYFEDNNIPIPWEGDFDEFMSNTCNTLRIG